MGQPQNDVMLILRRGDTVLLARRDNTGYADGLLNLPSGKVDPGEDPRAAIVREAREEIGVQLDRAAVRLAHVMFFRSPEGRDRVGWFFTVERDFTGTVVNSEPHKCSELLWAPVDPLPKDTVRYNALGIQHYLKGEPHSLHTDDWEATTW
ncbi:CTP pyrophosphohydrolase [Streptomyces sp. YIM 121038]|uniref:NUDIX hydrolase n=1 Tax=Streptomyces sp. YIM 121038 TaxID=2136401 RepID=UPI001162411D|nr:NUDIX domain-containing protein [Streptomyces sp. YIM 121038]QCX73930.1 CTP pyrophosphohydrolase [Streptomyces sp. YIM 121038]